jgi:hypothetical protein
MAISSITTTGAMGALATISGSSFGVEQWASSLYFYPNHLGFMELVTPLTWSDTEITVNIPTDAIVGRMGHFTLHVDGGPAQGERTTGFVILAEQASAMTHLQPDAYVTAKPGAIGVVPELEM